MTCQRCADLLMDNQRLRTKLADCIEDNDDLRTRLDFANDALADLDADRRLGRAREYGDPLTDVRPDMPQRGVA